jgi:hypothetical protein
MAIPKMWDPDGKMTGSSLVGAVLARRYKILETIDADALKAHDLALDQTVTVRQVSLTSQRASDTWCQKVHQLALVRNSNFLNILDVISDRSSDFVITERPKGRSIADVLRERSCLELEEVLQLVIPLAGALDLAADFSCWPNPISTCWLFTEPRSSFVDSEQRLIRDWPPFFVKLDVWELVRPRENNTWLFLTSKAQRGGTRGLAVRQAALLTYELLGGEKKREGKVKRWFQPVNGLGNAGNCILYRGLQGSPLFETSESFFHKLESTIQPGDGGSRALPAPASATQENSVALPRTSDMIRRFNRDTGWLATGVLGAMVFAALVLALLVQERYPKTDDVNAKAVQAGGDLLLNPNSATLASVVAKSSNSNGKMTPGQGSSIDHGLTENSQQEIPSSQTEPAASTPVLALSPEINRNDVQTNPDPGILARRQDSARAIGPKDRTESNRSSVASRYVSVKRRLIELWHQSLAKSEKARSWTAFSNLTSGAKKKAAYTAEKNH